ncbi:hypothetical protein NKH77_03045 [Streptomyces sp. M19]
MRLSDLSDRRLAKLRKENAALRAEVEELRAEREELREEAAGPPASYRNSSRSPTC